MATFTSSLRSMVIGLMGMASVFCSVPARGSERFTKYNMDQYDLVMHSDPVRPMPTYGQVFPTGLRESWLKALEHKDPELRRMLVDSLAMAHRRGMEDVDKLYARLLTLLRDPDPNLEVTRAVAAAFVALDGSEYAGRLAKMAIEHGPAIGEIIEPALARWGATQMHDIWLKRVLDATDGQTMMIHAIDGLASLPNEPGADRAAVAMKAIVVSSSQPAAVRTAAARAIGKLGIPKLMSLVDEVTAAESKPAELNSILAMELVGTRSDEDVIKFLTTRLDHSSSAVQSRALERLYAIDPALVDAQAERFMESRDTNVRLWSVRGMIASASLDRIETIANRLEDVNPSLRKEVAEALIKLAEQESLRPRVIEVTMAVLAKDQWRGCEQAAVVLARLEHRPAAKRMVELLSHERGEVKVSTAWGLKKLQVDEHLPAMLQHAQSVYDQFTNNQLNNRVLGASLGVAHLFEAFGIQSYEPAIPLLKKYLKKDFSLGSESRPAAAWALGKLLQNQPDNEVAPILLERLEDVKDLMSEIEIMREMCAISLGRMKAKIALDSLRKYSDTRTQRGYACYWAVEQLTGQKIPDLEPRTVRYEDWFLVPLKKPRSAANEQKPD